MCWYNGANAFELNREGLSANQTALWVPHLAGYPEYLVKCCRQDQRSDADTFDRPDRQLTYTPAISNVKEFEVDSAAVSFSTVSGNEGDGGRQWYYETQRTKA